MDKNRSMPYLAYCATWVCSKIIGHGAIETAALAELRRANSDAAAAAQLVDFVEEVDDIETDFDGCFCCDLDPARQVDVECLVRTELLSIGKTLAQAIPIEAVNPRAPIVPRVGNASGAGDALIMIEKDPVLLDVGELIRIEKKLCRTDVRPARPFVGRIQIRDEATAIVVCGEFASVNFAALVIERRKNKRLAELPFVQDRVRAFVKPIDAYIETFGNLLRHARIEIMRALRFRDGILLNGGFVGCAVEL